MMNNNEKIKEKSFDGVLSEQENTTGGDERFDISKYKDIEGITTKKLDLGLWYIEHKIFFKKILIIALGAIVGLSWSYTIYGFAYYFAKGKSQDEAYLAALARSDIASHENILKSSAKNLVYSTVTALSSSGNRYDLIATVKNQNLKFRGDFKYCFFRQGSEVDCSSSYIFPGEVKFIMALANKFSSKPSDVQFVVSDVNWSRIDGHIYGEWQEFKNEHINFSFSGINFKPASSSGLSDKLEYNTLDFTATNNSPYNYWNVGLNILLYRNNSLIGVNKFTIEEFLSGETKEVKMSWPGSIGQVSEVKISPEIDIMNENSYIEFFGGIGEEK